MPNRTDAIPNDDDEPRGWLAIYRFRADAAAYQAVSELVRFLFDHGPGRVEVFAVWIDLAPCIVVLREEPLVESAIALVEDHLLAAGGQPVVTDRETEDQLWELSDLFHDLNSATLSPADPRSRSDS